MNLRALDFRTDLLPFIIATAGEFTALYFWLYYLDQGQFLLANAILWGGFAVERTAVYLWIRYSYREEEHAVDRSFFSVFGALFLITLTEVLIWILWLALADGQIVWLDVGFVENTLLAGGVLMGLMLIEHSVEMAGLRQRSPLTYLTNGNTIFVTLMEVLGAVGWLYLVRTDRPVLGTVCLLVGLSIEHELQGGELRPEEDPGAEVAPCVFRT
ncbi:MAG: hypothetical protein GVY15_12345 [Bacteroidetes bacterium]|jgi:hypothetical protein|nr:hypothetical protein [Bacteroidota bacterium]